MSFAFAARSLVYAGKIFSHCMHPYACMRMNRAGGKPIPAKGVATLYDPGPVFAANRLRGYFPRFLISACVVALITLGGDLSSPRKWVDVIGVCETTIMESESCSTRVVSTRCKLSKNVYYWARIFAND